MGAEFTEGGGGDDDDGKEDEVEVRQTASYAHCMCYTSQRFHSVCCCHDSLVQCDSFSLFVCFVTL